MPKIENVPQIAVELGTHRLPAKGSILIQITDPDGEFVVPKFKDDFEHIVQYKFYDVTAPLWGNDKLLEPITQDQADFLVRILEFALEMDYDVVVHCTAGLCRSGAVTEVGVIMGFDAVHDNRLPNVEVKSKMLRCLNESH